MQRPHCGFTPQWLKTSISCVAPLFSADSTSASLMARQIQTYILSSISWGYFQNSNENHSQLQAGIPEGKFPLNSLLL
jgi:hypothetical protein